MRAWLLCASVVMATGLPACSCNDSIGTPGVCDTPTGAPSYVAPTILSAPVDTPLAVYYFHIGAGDAVLIDYGDVEVLIDGGKDDDELAELLRDSGLVADGRIELAIITHGDKDHFGGMRGVLLGDNAFQVPELWQPGYGPGDTKTQPRCDFEEFLGCLADVSGIVRWRRPLQCFHRPLTSPEPAGTTNGIAFAVVDDGAPMDLETARLKLRLLHSDMAPTTLNLEDDGEQDESLFSGSEAYRINNASIVVALEYDSARFLFTGDINGRVPKGDCQLGEVEKLLVDRASAYLPSAVLKVAHHGSDTSNHPDIINAVAPTFAIIQPNEIAGAGPPTPSMKDWFRGDGTNCGQTVTPTLSRLLIPGDGGVAHVRCTVVASAVDCGSWDF